MSRPLRVVVTRPLPSTFELERFEGRVEIVEAQAGDELRQAVRDADILYSWTVPDNVPSQTPRLRWIEVPSAGVDHLRDEPVWFSDITITSSTGIHTVPMSEHLFAMLLALTRHIPALVRAQDRSEWLPHSRIEQMHLTEVRGTTMGIVGWGKIGEGVAHLANAFGVRVVGTRRTLRAAREIARQAHAYANPPWLLPPDLPPDVAYPASDLDTVLRQSDIVVLFLPLTEETRGSFAAEQFNSMRRGSLFFNLGRGAVHDERALIEALESGQLRGAGLDVFDPEPLPRSSPLWQMSQVIISPHIAGMSDRTAERAAHLFIVNLGRYLAGEPLLNVVDRNRGY